MFCRKCGKTLLDGDRFCSYCGAQVIERTEDMDMVSNFEEVVYNNDVKTKPDDDDITKENIANNSTVKADVPKMNITQTWQEINEKNEEKFIKPEWNLEGFPGGKEDNKKSEDIKVDWEKRKLLRFDTPVAGESLEFEGKPKEIKAELNLTSKPDIFDIFDKQQKEEEAEINSKDTLVFKRAVPIQDELESDIGKDLLRESVSTKSIKSTRNKIHTSEEEQIDKFYTFSKKNEEFQKLLDKEYERLKNEPNFTPPVEKQVPSNIEKLEINTFEPKIEIVPDKVEIVTDKIGIVPELTVESASIDEYKLKPDSEIKLDSDIKPNKEGILEGKTTNITEIEEPKPAAMESEIKEEKEKEPQSPLPWDGMENQVGEFREEDKDKKISPLAVGLTIIILLLAFEVSVLGIKCFFPESSAATFINEKMGVTVNWIDALKTNKQNSDDAKKQEAAEAEKKAKAEKIAENKAAEALAEQKPDPLPRADKASLIAESLAYNINIKSIVADDSLAYTENKDYGDKDINTSKAIENNIWYQDELGNSVYYDKEVVKTIIQFDSAWIDYVNKKDETVFDLLKADSKAYRNAKSFSKAGKVTESFDTLKIGEIRQSESGFYVWVYEGITITEKEKSKVVDYNYIYYMEPVDRQLKIVSYKEI